MMSMLNMLPKASEKVFGDGARPQRLGHRSITSTEIYTHLINFEGDEYHTATSKSLEEDEELLKAGFEYVTERDEVKIFRKRK